MRQALADEFTAYIAKMLGCDDAGFADIKADRFWQCWRLAS
jgi:hypothetical protein